MVTLYLSIHLSSSPNNRTPPRCCFIRYTWKVRDGEAHRVLLDNPPIRRYKREAYRASEYAPRILTADGLQVVMKVRPTAIRGSVSPV